jgi:hypothetical protein
MFDLPRTDVLASSNGTIYCHHHLLISVDDNSVLTNSTRGGVPPQLPTTEPRMRRSVVSDFTIVGIFVVLRLSTQIAAFSLRIVKTHASPRIGYYGMRGRTLVDIDSRPTPRSRSTIFQNRDGEGGGNDEVQVGSREYLEGFISSPIQDDSVAKRGSGLEQALKLGGSVAVGLLALFLGFMASNGLL